jgi:hypothetical protein
MFTKNGELSAFIKRMWQQDKVIVGPVTISSTGVVPKKINKSI